MPRVVYIGANGEITSVQVASGDSVLDGALDHGVDGLIGQCGGGCTCATCHCYVEAAWLPLLPVAHPDEAEILDYVIDRTANSRLACQLKMSCALDGITVKLPRRQLPG